MRIELLPLSLFLVLWSACAAPAKTARTGGPLPPGTEETPASSTEASSVEISYVRGHNEHRLIAALHGNAAVARSFLDHQILAEGAVDQAKYLNFLQRASEFLKGPRKGLSDPLPCRSPFTVTVRIGGETQAISGCLTSDEGALSHLVRDGEFLLHQGSGMRIK